MSTRGLLSRLGELQRTRLGGRQAQCPAYVCPAAGAQRSEHGQRGAMASNTTPLSVNLTDLPVRGWCLGPNRLYLGRGRGGQ